MTVFSRRLLAVLLTSVVLGLTACSPIVPMDAAPDAANPMCAEVTVRLPDAIDNNAKRETDAQATGAWGNPATILLRCGVAVPGPSALLCVTLKGIDWLRDNSGAPNYVFTTYGRDPAVQVIVDGNRASGTNALVAVSNAVGSIPATRACTNPDDVLGVPDPTPSPTSSPTP